MPENNVWEEELAAQLQAHPDAELDILNANDKILYDIVEVRWDSSIKRIVMEIE